MRLVVTHDLAQLRKAVEAEVPGAHVEIVPSGANGLIVRGSVRTPLDARGSSARSAPPSEPRRGRFGPGRRWQRQWRRRRRWRWRRIRRARPGRRARAEGDQPAQREAVLPDQHPGPGGRSVPPPDASARPELGRAPERRQVPRRHGRAWRRCSMPRRRRPPRPPTTGPISQPGTDGPAAWSARRTPSATSTAASRAVINALNQEGLATLLAEPNLTAMSGETASFSAGGEVPVVLVTNNNVSITYKPYGVIMRMTPTLLSPNRIQPAHRPRSQRPLPGRRCVSRRLEHPGVQGAPRGHDRRTRQRAELRPGGHAERSQEPAGRRGSRHQPPSGRPACSRTTRASRKGSNWSSWQRLTWSNRPRKPIFRRRAKPALDRHRKSSRPRPRRLRLLRRALPCSIVFVSARRSSR